MTDKVRVGVIGTGGFGILHVRIFSELENAKLVALAAKTEKRVRPLAEQYHTDWYTDYRELLARDDIDAVSICLPTNLHHEVAVAALESGKHVLLEKPIASTVKEASHIVEVAKESKGLLMVGHTERFNISLRRAKDLIDEGAIGQPVMISTKRRTLITRPSDKRWEEGGLVEDLSSHDVDIIRWFMGDEICKVHAEVDSLVMREKGKEDSGAFLLRFNSGGIGIIEVSYALPSTFPVEENDTRIDIVGTEGTLMINDLEQTLALCNKNKGWFYPGILRFPGRSGGKSALPSYALKDEMQHFVRCVLGKEEPIISGEDAKRVLEVIAAAMESARTGQPVKLSRLEG